MATHRIVVLSSGLLTADEKWLHILVDHDEAETLRLLLPRLQEHVPVTSLREEPEDVAEDLLGDDSPVLWATTYLSTYRMPVRVTACEREDGTVYVVEIARRVADIVEVRLGKDAEAVIKVQDDVLRHASYLLSIAMERR